ncbi:hypothetical protein CCP3SC1_30069 [Gammaproteobacteria bacterium]
MVVQASTVIQQRETNAGLYFSAIHDEYFLLRVPKKFIPRRFDLGSSPQSANLMDKPLE